MSTKSGIGVSENAVTELTLLRASCIRPGSPPMYSQAPMMLMVMKVSATGMPMNSNTVEPPSMSQAAMLQLLMAGSRCAHRVMTRTPWAVLQADHAKDHFDSK